MRPLRFLGALSLTLVAHTLAVGLHPRIPKAIDFFLVLVVLNALFGGSLSGLLGGAAAGLSLDALSGTVFGLHGFAATIVGYAANRISQRLVLRRALGVLLLVMAAVLAQAVVLFAVSAIVLRHLIVPDPPWLLIRAASSGLLGAVLYVSLTSWQSGADARRQRRTRRLKLG